MASNRKQRIHDRHTRDDDIVQREELNKILGSPNGRRLFWGLLSDAGVFQNPHSGNALDSAFNAGRMQMGHLILTRITDADPEAFIKMQQDNLRIQQALEERLRSTEEEEDDYATE